MHSEAQHIHIKKLTDITLLQKTNALSQEERRISIEVLHYLQEVNKRKAYSSLGYVSLYDYMTTELKYADASAVRRIHAMHALQQNPEIAEKLKTGKLSVTQAAKVQAFVHKDERETGIKWKTSEKSELFEKAEVLSRNDLEKEFVLISPKAAITETTKPVAENLTELKIYLSDSELAILNELRGLIAHELKNPGSNSELIKRLIHISKTAVVQKKTQPSINRHPKPLADEGRTNTSNTSNISTSSNTIKNSKNSTKLKSDDPKDPEIDQVTDLNSDILTTPTPQRSSRYIPASDKRTLFRNSSLRCEHVDPKTKIRCDSKFKLEIDHKIPHSLGGSNNIENLRVLCRSHNALRTKNL